MSNKPIGKPPWLDGNTDIIDLLSILIGKLDRRKDNKRAVSIKLKPSNTPWLYKLDSQADQQWDFIKSLSSDHSVIEITPDKKLLIIEPEWQNARLTLIQNHESDLRQWLDQPVNNSRQLWAQQVKEYAGYFPGSIEKLQSPRRSIDNQTDSDVILGFARLNQYIDKNLTLRQLSAACFWGESKFLDNKLDLIVSLFPGIQVRIRPILVNAYVPIQAKTVLFVENQDSYINAMRGEPITTRDTIIVYCSGYQSTAERSRENDGVSLHYHSPSRSLQTHFENWWYQKLAESDLPCFFWGDLDFAGMSILKSLKLRFPTITAWQPGYKPMLAHLKNKHAHSMEFSKKQGQDDPRYTGCPYADDILLPAIRRYQGFVDQEVVI